MIAVIKNNLVVILLSFSLTVIFGCLNNARPPADSTSVTAQTDNTVPSLALPVDCNLGTDCFILQYVDSDPSSQAVDFNCGRQTYDGHKGTDFGVSDLQKMNAGIPVLAAEQGTVLRIRDGVVDRLVNSSVEKANLEGQECGNGVVIDHSNGWETQYCHLQQGSVAVKPGDTVETGTVLGKIGASGLAAFPHVHFSVRHQGKIVDPFVGAAISESGCEVERDFMWEQPLNYVPTGLIRAGFASQPPTQSELWQGKYQEDRLASTSPALIFWVHAYGVLQGDIETWRLIAPNGEIAIEQDNNLDKPYRSWVSYIGKRQFASGTWQGEYQLIRNKQPLITVSRQVSID